MAEEGGDGQDGKRRGKKRKLTKKRRKGRGSAGRAKEGRRRIDLISAIDHPIRRRMLRAVVDCGEARSSVQLSRELHLTVGIVSYHFRVLRGFGAVEPAGERMVRGAVEHFYESTIEDDPPIEALLKETRAADEEDA